MGDLLVTSQRGHRSVLRSLAIGLSLVTIACIEPMPLEACPTCKDGVAASGTGLATGFYWSILFMLGMPLSLATGWLFFIWRSLRRAGSVPPSTVASSLSV